MFSFHFVFQAFSGTVLEKETPKLVTDSASVSFKETSSGQLTSQDSQPKRVSKFKAERQKKMSPS